MRLLLPRDLVLDPAWGSFRGFAVDAKACCLGDRGEQPVVPHGVEPGVEDVEVDLAVSNLLEQGEVAITVVLGSESPPGKAALGTHPASTSSE